MSKTRFPWIMAVACFFPGGFLFGQTALSPTRSPIVSPSPTPINLSPTQIASVTLTFELEQQTLAQSFDTLVTQGVTSQQMQAWQTQNAPAFQAQQQLAIEMGTASSSQPLTPLDAAVIPSGAMADLANFLTTRVDLYNKYVALYNQQLSSGTTANVGQTFQAQNADEIKAQAQETGVLAAQSNSQPLEVPDPLSIPPGTSSQMATFLTLRDQIMRDQVTVWNQNLTSTPAQRNAAFQQLQQQDAARLQQMQQLAQNIAQSTAN